MVNSVNKIVSCCRLIRMFLSKFRPLPMKDEIEGRNIVLIVLEWVVLVWVFNRNPTQVGEFCDRCFATKTSVP